MFSKHSLENAPENWHSDPIYAKVFKSCMLEVLGGEDEGGVFPIVKVMEKIKEKQPKGYDFAVYRDKCGCPCGVMQMTPAQRRAFVRWGDLFAADSQEKVKNYWGWVGIYPAGYNGNNKLQSYCDALTLESDDRFYAWTAKNMCSISRRSPQTIKIISCDMGPSPVDIKSYLPGELTVVRAVSFSFCTWYLSQVLSHKISLMHSLSKITGI